MVSFFNCHCWHITLTKHDKWKNTIWLLKYSLASNKLQNSLKSTSSQMFHSLASERILKNSKKKFHFMPDKVMISRFYWTFKMFSHFSQCVILLCHDSCFPLECILCCSINDRTLTHSHCSNKKRYSNHFMWAKNVEGDVSENPCH